MVLIYKLGVHMLRLRLLLSHHAIQIAVLVFAFGLIYSYFNSPAWVCLLVPIGIILQMLNEYSLHRFIFHLKPPKKQWMFNLLYQAHYGHHDFPTNHRLFFVPIWVVVPMLITNISVTWLVASLIMPNAAFSIAAAIICVGGVGTFLSYEWFHMTSHLNLPKTWIERDVTTLHNQHHFRDFSKWFHVSPGGFVIDRAMGTAIDQASLKAQQRIEFIRTMGLRPDDPRLIFARKKYADYYDLTADEIARAAFMKNEQA